MVAIGGIIAVIGGVSGYSLIILILINAVWAP